MFEEYAKKLEQLGENVPKVFNTVAKKGAIHARNTAIEITNREGLVDTGAYRRNWNGESGKTKNDTYAITLENSMEYASFLEDGYTIRKAHFVPFSKLNGTPKTQSLINSFKQKYPNSKGVMFKPRHFKARKIGKLSLIDTEGFVITLLAKEAEAILLGKKLGISKKEAKKLL